MSTEEVIVEKTETVKQSKPKRRFKLDKKHIQGFIAGILLCAIAFTGLYYGTDGRFFKGEMYDNYRHVNYLDFERYVIKSKLPVLVVFLDNNCSNKEFSKYSQQIRDIAVFYNGIITFASTAERSVSRRYVINEFPTYCIFKNGEIVSRKEGNLTLRQLFDWLIEEYGY